MPHVESKMKEYLELSSQREILLQQILDGTYTNKTLADYLDLSRQMAAIYDALPLEVVPA